MFQKQTAVKSRDWWGWISNKKCKSKSWCSVPVISRITTLQKSLYPIPWNLKLHYYTYKKYFVHMIKKVKTGKLPYIGLPWWLRWERICLQCGTPGFDPWVGKIPWRKAQWPTPVFLPGESPWTGEPGGLHSMGLQRVGHDWTTNHTALIIWVGAV